MRLKWVLNHLNFGKSLKYVTNRPILSASVKTKLLTCYCTFELLNAVRLQTAKRTKIFYLTYFCRNFLDGFYN